MQPISSIKQEELKDDYEHGTLLLDGTRTAPGSVILIGADTNVGKSTVALWLCGRFEGTSLFMSLEDDITEFAVRRAVVPRARQPDVWVHYEPEISIDKYFERVESVIDLTLDLKFVVIDYVQLFALQLADQFDPFIVLLSKIKAHANKFGYVLCLTSQLNPPKKDEPHRMFRGGQTLLNQSETGILLRPENKYVVAEVIKSKRNRAKIVGRKIFLSFTSSGELTEAPY